MENLSMIIRPISSTAVSLYPQTIYFIAMVFGVMTFGILSDIVGRKKVTHIFISWDIDLCHLFSSSIFSSKVLIPLMVCMSISGMITSYMQSWKKSMIWTWCHFLSHKYVQNTGHLFINILWNIKSAFTIDSWDKNESTNLSQRFFPTFLLCPRSSGS